MIQCFLRSPFFLFLAIISLPTYGAADYSIKTLAELKECEVKAEKGDANSLYALGGYYFKGEIIEGKIVARDAKKAVALMTAAAEKGNMDAQEKLCFIYSRNIWVSQDWGLAVKWGKLAAAQGHVLATFELADMYSKGHGGSKADYEELVGFFGKAARSGEVGAPFGLAKLYAEGVGVSEDQAKAFYWFKLAAERGHHLAKTEVANRYYEGKGVGKDFAQAFEWYIKASDGWNPYAKRRVGLCFYQGEGVAKDYVEAVAWFRKSYEDSKNMGGLDKLTMYLLGVCYEEGNGVTKDYVQALYWYRAAATEGHSVSKYHVGIYYVNGFGVARDDIEAYAWLNLAAATEDSARADLNELEKKLSREEVVAGQSRTKALAKELESKRGRTRGQAVPLER
jgi:TPR repeat protein